MQKIGLFSDPHATVAPVQACLDIFQQQQVNQIWCAGDVAGYGNQLADTLTLIENAACCMVYGNHEEAYLQSETQTDKYIHDYFSALPVCHESRIEGLYLYMVHASPPDQVHGGIRLLDQVGKIDPDSLQNWQKKLKTFQPDILIVGHTHQVFAEKIANTLVINPGSCCYNHSCAVLTLPDCKVEWFSLSGKKIIKSWHWGMVVKQDGKA